MRSIFANRKGFDSDRTLTPFEVAGWILNAHRRQCFQPCVVKSHVDSLVVHIVNTNVQNVMNDLDELSYFFDTMCNVDMFPNQFRGDLLVSFAEGHFKKSIPKLHLSSPSDKYYQCLKTRKRVDLMDSVKTSCGSNETT